jgi:hypothetical protein
MVNSINHADNVVAANENYGNLHLYDYKNGKLSEKQGFGYYWARFKAWITSQPKLDKIHLEIFNEIAKSFSFHIETETHNFEQKKTPIDERITAAATIISQRNDPCPQAIKDLLNQVKDAESTQIADLASQSRRTYSKVDLNKAFEESESHYDNEALIRQYDLTVNNPPFTLQIEEEPIQSDQIDSGLKKLLDVEDNNDPRFIKVMRFLINPCNIFSNDSSFFVLQEDPKPNYHFKKEGDDIKIELRSRMQIQLFINSQLKDGGLFDSVDTLTIHNNGTTKYERNAYIK